MISVHEARSMVLQRLSVNTPASIPLSDALGLRLAGEVIAQADQPAFDRSAMDGFAFPAKNGLSRMRVLGEAQPGEGRNWVVGEGECVRIYTGGKVPSGCDCVLPQESARREGDWMTPLSLPERSWIRKRGEDARAGDRLMRVGMRLAPGDIALLASVGVECPLVWPRARVVHVVTGNELVAVSDEPKAGQIRDSNSSLIGALLREAGAVLMNQARAGDSLNAVLKAVGSGGKGEWDVLLLSGGAGGGDFDFGARALDELGFQIHFRTVNLRPGKPLIFGTRGGQVAFVIPGNPVSHFVTFHLVIRLALEVLMGLQGGAAWGDPAVETVCLPLKKPWVYDVDRRETWCPARVEIMNGRTVVEPLAWQSSGDLCGLVGANGLVRVRSGVEAVDRFGNVECLLLGLRSLSS